MPDNFKEKDQGRHTFQAVAGTKVTSFDTDHELFLGPYRTYANPQVVEKGQCNNHEAYGNNPCGCLQVELELDPGETKEFVVLLGIGKADIEGTKAVRDFSDMKNENGVEKGIQRMVLNGIEIPGNLIGLNDMREKNEVRVIMG